MTHKVKVIEAAVSSVSIQGIWPHDPARPQTTMDQCAVAFDSLIHEHKDVVTMCEYLCFFTNLWHYRSSSVGPRSFVLEARKFTEVTKIFVSAVELNANDNGELSRFHSVWKIVSMLDTLEPNLFQFLSQSDHSIHEVVFDFEYEIPHEIVGLFVTFLTMRRTLVPTARSLLKVGHPCNDCEDQSSHHKCDHSGISLQELLEDMIDLQNTVEKLFYETVKMYMSHPLVKRFDGTICVLVLLSLVGMYAGDWEGALIALHSIGQNTLKPEPKKLEFAQRYANICRLVILYNRQRNEQGDSKMSLASVGEDKATSHGSLLNGTLYNNNVDMAKYGYENLSEYSLEIRHTSNGEMTTEIYADKIVIKTKDGIKTIPHNKKTDDLEMTVYFHDHGMKQNADDIWLDAVDKIRSNRPNDAPLSNDDVMKLFTDLHDQLFL